MFKLSTLFDHRIHFPQSIYELAEHVFSQHNLEAALRNLAGASPTLLPCCSATASRLIQSQREHACASEEETVPLGTCDAGAGKGSAVEQGMLTPVFMEQDFSFLSP